MEWRSAPSSPVDVTRASESQTWSNAVIGVAGEVHARRIGPCRIGLHADRIYGEQHSLAAILKGVEEHRDVIVASYVFAPGKVTANQSRTVVVADEYEIDCGAWCGRSIHRYSEWRDSPSLGVF